MACIVLGLISLKFFLVLLLLLFKNMRMCYYFRGVTIAWSIDSDCVSAVFGIFCKDVSGELSRPSLSFGVRDGGGPWLSVSAEGPKLAGGSVGGFLAAGLRTG